MTYKSLIIGFAAIVVSFSLQAQDTWSLERCIEHAQKNSITIKQSQLQLDNAALNIRQSRASRYPALNFNTNLGYNFGRVIDPSTNQFTNTGVGFNSGGLNVNELVYDGGRVNSTIKQSRLNREAAEADLAQTIQNISLNVAAAYLQVLLAEEQNIAAKNRVEQSEQQLDQMDKLIAAGSRPANDRLDFVAQLATNEQALVSARNQIDISYLNLKQLLELDPELPFKIIKPEINIPLNNDVEGLTLRAVFNQAYSRQPQIRAGELRLKSASLDADIAKSDWLPTLSIFGNLSSNYSTASPKNILKNNAVPSGSSIQTVPFISHINGAKVTAGIERPTYTSDQYKNYTYFNQISDNFGQALGLTLQIPIYDRGITRIAVERAKIGLINQQLSNQRTQQVLKSDIQAALANARAAKKQLEASDKTFTAVKGAYENIDKKYKVGAATTFEMTTARNNMDTAERNLIISRFDYIFKLKIVDFYQGKKITLD
ncbi:MAG: TolC family protein [Saprospiraceae bacterium]